MKTDSQRWGKIKSGKLIEFIKIHRYEKCDEFSYPLMDEVVKRLEEHNKMRGIITNPHLTGDHTMRDLLQLVKSASK